MIILLHELDFDRANICYESLLSVKCGPLCFVDFFYFVRLTYLNSIYSAYLLNYFSEISLFPIAGLF